MDLTKLPDVSFAQRDPATIESNVRKIVEGLLGRTLARADPLRVFLDAVDLIIIQQREKINEAARQNLLAYATEGNLDHLGAFVDVGRLEESAATTTMHLTLSTARSVSTSIPAGTRFTAGDGVYFALDETVTILAGDTTADGSATCISMGETGNGYAVGEICKIVDPVAYLSTAANTTESEGGAASEQDDSYRERIHEAPESFSCAGPYGAYEYWAKSASSLVADVKVLGHDDAVEMGAPSMIGEGEVQVYVLLSGGDIPGAELLNSVKETVNAEDKRPLTDKVTVLSAEKVGYTAQVTYYVDREDEATADTIQEAVQEAADEWELWQKSKLGRDINPSRLIAKIYAAGAKRVELEAPEFTVVKPYQVAIAEAVTINYGGLEDG